MKRAGEETFEEMARRVKPEEVEHALGKTRRRNFLLTPIQNEAFQAAAKRYGLSVTDYIIRLHELAESKTRERRTR